MKTENGKVDGWEGGGGSGRIGRGGEGWFSSHDVPCKPAVLVVVLVTPSLVTVFMCTETQLRALEKERTKEIERKECARRRESEREKQREMRESEREKHEHKERRKKKTQPFSSFTKISEGCRIAFD